MDREYCYLINISHPEGCPEDYVITDIFQVSLCIKAYLSDYTSCSLSFNRLEVFITQVQWKGGSVDGQSKKDAS